MGFGILLIGYFLSFATALAKVYFFADIIGGLIMTYALYKLSSYGNEFKNSVYSSMAFTVMSLFCAVTALIGNSGSLFFTAISTVRTGTILLLHIYMLSALMKMAQGAEDEKLVKKARWNMGIVTVYYVFYILFSLLSEFIAAFGNSSLNYFLNLLMYFYGAACIILNLLVLHSAYARLYIQGTEDPNAVMPEFKESRNKLINSIRLKFYNSQKKAFEENSELVRKTRQSEKASLERKNKSKGKKKGKR